jgi:uncharacterized membrane protein
MMNDAEAARRFIAFSSSSRALRSVELVRLSAVGNRVSREARSARASSGRRPVWRRRPGWSSHPAKNAATAGIKKNKVAET